MAIHWQRAKAGIAAACLMAAGCENAPPPPVREQEAVDLGPITERVNNMESRLSSLDGPAKLKLSDDGFSTKDSAIGRLTIQWIKSTKVGSGTEATFRIGNPTSATIRNVSAFILIYDPDDKPINRPNEFRFAFSGHMPPGSWSTMTTIIDGIPPERIAALSITSIFFGTVALR